MFKLTRSRIAICRRQAGLIIYLLTVKQTNTLKTLPGLPHIVLSTLATSRQELLFVWKNKVSVTGVTAVGSWCCGPSQCVTLFQNSSFSSRRIEACSLTSKVTSSVKMEAAFLTLYWPFLEPWKLHLVLVRFVRWAQDVWLGSYPLGGGCGVSAFSITVQAGDLKSVCEENFTDDWVWGGEVFWSNEWNWM